MTEQLYDRVPYDTHAFPFTHPRNMAAVARLRGLYTADPNHCRVLELGCAAGGNLIPMAFHHPGSRYMGIDSSREQIKSARAMQEELGLTNIEFHCMDLMDFDTDLGPFDYIITHGVYSWVPPHVQNRILEIFGASLAENGVAFVNYLTYPGAYLTQITREMMRYKTREIGDIEERLKQSRINLQNLVNILPVRNDPYLNILKHLSATVSGKSDSYLLHDDLGEIYSPLYFHELVGKARGYRLQYVGDAEFVSKGMSPWPAGAMNRLLSLSNDIEELEQQADFLSHPLARCSLWCRNSTSLKAEFSTSQLDDLYLSSFAFPTNGPNGEKAFRNIWGGTLYDPDPVFQRVLQRLTDCYPDAIPFRELADGQNDRGASLAMKLLKARAQNIVGITVDKPFRHHREDTLPAASRLSQLQARVGSEATSAWHENIGLDDISRLLLACLDGRHTREEILERMFRYYQQGKFELPESGAEDQRSTLSAALERRLDFLSHSGLLTTPSELAPMADKR